MWLKDPSCKTEIFNIEDNLLDIRDIAMVIDAITHSINVKELDLSVNANIARKGG